jgi:SagB-type dehydrogenase family enzyme
MWAAQGIVSDASTGFKHRTSPSAGGKYPLVLYAISDLGVHMYRPMEHTLKKLVSDDRRGVLSVAALADLNQQALKIAPLTVVIAVDNQTASSISPLWEDALRYVHLEAGHVAQNLALQAEGLGLGVCTITSYRPRAAYGALRIPIEHRPIYLLPVGYPSNHH